MRAYWFDGGEEVTPDDARGVSLEDADRIFADGRGVEGNFFGLIDDEDRTIQFYFTQSIPDDVEDARHLPIVWMDFPIPHEGGSYGRQVTIGEVSGLIAHAFAHGADHTRFGDLAFSAW